MLFFNLETENDVVNEENENTKSEVVENETTSENELCEAEPLETSDVQTMSEEAVTEASPEPVEETAKIVPEETSETEFAQENINALGYVEPCDNDGAFAESTPAGTGAGEATAMAVKEIVRSKTMIVSAIAFTISVVLSVILSFLSGVSANRFAADAAGILNSLELGYEFIPVKMYGWDMSFVLSALVAAFSIFAVWNIFFIGRKKNGKTIGMSGVTVFWVYSMIGVVISGFTLILFGIVCLVMSVGGGFIALFDVGIELASYLVTGVLGVFAIVLVLTLLYFLLTANSLSSFKKAVKTDEPVAKGSAYVGLVLILGGISNIFAFGTLFVLGAAVLLGFGVSGVNVALYVPVFLLSELSVAAIAVYNIGFGVLMFRYKSSMKKIRKQFER